MATYGEDEKLRKRSLKTAITGGKTQQQPGYLSSASSRPDMYPSAAQNIAGHPIYGGLSGAGMLDAMRPAQPDPVAPPLGGNPAGYNPIYPVIPEALQGLAPVAPPPIPPQGYDSLPWRRAGKGAGLEYNLPGRRAGGVTYAPTVPQQAPGNTGLINAAPSMGDVASSAAPMIPGVGAAVGGAQALGDVGGGLMDAFTYAGDNIQRSAAQLGNWFGGMLPDTSAQAPAQPPTVAPAQQQPPMAAPPGLPQAATPQMGTPSLPQQNQFELSFTPGSGLDPAQAQTAEPPPAAFDVGYGGIQGRMVPPDQQGQFGQVQYSNIPGGTEAAAYGGGRGIPASMPGQAATMQQGGGLAATTTPELVSRFRAKNERMKQAQGLSSALNVQSPHAERTAIRNAQVGVEGESRYGDTRSRYNVGKGRRAGYRGRAHEDSGAMGREKIRSGMQQDFDQRRAKYAAGLSEMAAINQSGEDDRMEAVLNQAAIQHEAQQGGLDRASQEYQARLGVKPPSPLKQWESVNRTLYEGGIPSGQETQMFNPYTGEFKGGRSGQKRTASEYMAKMKEAGLKPGSAEYKEKLKDMEAFIEAGQLTDDRK